MLKLFGRVSKYPVMEEEFLEVRANLASYLHRLTANRHDAEDLLQDTYLRVSENFSSFRGQSSFKTWVFSIATNLARDHFRVQKRWKLDAQDECKAEAVRNPAAAERIVSAFRSQEENNFEIREHINYCFTCIAKNLELEKQIAVILKEIYDFDRLEIASILNVTEGVVKHLLHDGRKELQTKYDHRCALVNKNGVCYQCGELNNFLQGRKDAETKVGALGVSPSKDSETNLAIRFEIIKDINPLEGKGAKVEETILQILNEVLERK